MTLENLNPQQLQAVRHSEGPLMVVAGAGSGKTRVITCRIAHLIKEKGISPESILAITFTNKAAGEMKERVRNMLDLRGAFPWVSTFHSFCLRILRQHISELGFSNDFVIYDAQDQLTLVKQCMKVAQISAEAFPPKTLLHHISGFKNDFLMPEDLQLEAMPYGHQLKAAGLYPGYQSALKKNNALDFDDLLVFAVRLFQECPTLQSYYNDKFRYILVDEFQDTNAAQYKLVRLLSQSHHNICVVGDDDQSIYRWRGANIENILKFENDFPGTTVIKLEENYRSTQNILNAAGGVVRENRNRRDKTLWTKNEKGSPVLCYKAGDENDEADFVCEKILALNRDEGFSFNEMAILYRTNAQSRVMEDMLRRKGLPYQVIGGLRFYERREIKDVLAYMRVVLNPSDSVSLKRILNVPARGIGKTSVEKVEAYCREKGLTLLEGLRDNEQGKMTAPAAGRKISQFLEIIAHLDATFQQGNPLDLLREVIDRTPTQSTLDLGAYVDVGDQQAISVESVDFIIQARNTADNTFSNSLTGAATGNTQWTMQLMDLNPGSLFQRADDNTLVASGATYLDDTNSVISIGPDMYPDNFGKLDESRMVVNDSLFLLADFHGSALAPNRSYVVTVRIKCRIVKLSTKDWMAIAIQSTASDN